MKNSNGPTIEEIDDWNDQLQGHRFAAFEEDFLEDGTIGVCLCGWRSSRQVDVNKATEHLKARQEVRQHVWLNA